MKQYKKFREMLKNEYKNIASFKKYLEIQRYDDELEHLEKKYGLPHGNYIQLIMMTKLQVVQVLKRLMKKIVK